MTNRTILIFGESQKGELQKFLFLKTLPDLAEALGEPTETGLGIHMAIQAMLFNQSVLFYKVKEEGFNIDHYLMGFKLLEKEFTSILLTAIALPGASSPPILEIADSLCKLHKSLILFNEKDLYDFMTRSSS